MIPKEVTKTLWAQRGWAIIYHGRCPDGSCDCWLDGPIIVLKNQDGFVADWHTRRLLLPNRTPMECLALAFERVARAEAAATVAREEAQILSEEAEAIAEAAESSAIIRSYR